MTRQCTTGWVPSSTSPPIPEPGAASCSTLRWTDIDLDARRITITSSTAVIAGERIDGTTKSGRARVVSIDDGTVAVLRQHQAGQAADQHKAGDSWRGVKDGRGL